VATTGQGTAHRHKTKAGYWSDKTDIESASPHTHTVDLSQYVTKAEFDALVARVSALETVRTISFKTA
jgi:hypothetical protein